MKLNEQTQQDLIEHVENILVPHTAFTKALNRLEQGMKVAPFLRDPLGYFISGESRTGKSRVIEEFRSRYARLRTPEGMEIPVLYVSVPSNPTEKGLATAILAALEDPLAYKGTELDKTSRLLTLLRECKTKMLILDEFQHFVDKTANFAVLHRTSDWLKSLLNDAKVVTVIAGLPYGNSVLAQNQQLRGRIPQTIMIPRFDWRDDASRMEFMGLLDGFTEIMRERFDFPDIGEENFAFRFFLATGGITGYIFNLIRQAAWNAITVHDKTKLTLKDFEEAYTEAIHSLDYQAINPFSLDARAFSGEALERAYTIGCRSDDYPDARTRRRTRAKTQLTAANV
jgi:hypothetical protein